MARIPRSPLALALVLLVGVPAAADPPAAPVHSVILIVPDGLRADAVDEAHAPALARLARDGVRLGNSHALFPTFTMPNSSALATGHALGDTGVFGNSLLAGYPVTPAAGSIVPFIENDAVLGDLDAHFDGDLLGEPTLLAAARRLGYDTAAVGKVGPTLVFDHTERSGALTVVIDDATPKGIPLSEEMTALLTKAALPTATPARGPNGDPGDATRPGTLVANGLQQAYFQTVITQVLLPRFKERGRPFLMVFWSRDPDGTQHFHGDHPGELTPGITGPTSLAAVRNVDSGVASIRAALDSLGLGATTDLIVAADHGFTTIAKGSETSPAARARAGGGPAGQLPPGFVALDLATALGLKVYDPDDGNQPVLAGQRPKKGNGLLAGGDALPTRDGAPDPEVVVVANGGADLIYLPRGRSPELLEKAVAALFAQDYVSGVFVDDALGAVPGTLPLSAIGLKGSAKTPTPAIVVSFRSFVVAEGRCQQPLLCTAAVSDTTLRQGQGMHGTFSRADTRNFMAAIGPDFRARFDDPAPASNADVGRTIARLMKLDLDAGHHGALVGRVLDEALQADGRPLAKPGKIDRSTLQSSPRGGLRTEVSVQVYGGVRYFDAGGFRGRTVGL